MNTSRTPRLLTGDQTVRFKSKRSKSRRKRRRAKNQTENGGLTICSVESKSPRELQIFTSEERQKSPRDANQ